MKHVVNTVSENEWLKEYKDREDMNSFIKECKCDGAEVIRGGDDNTGIYCSENVVGVHLYFYPSWLDFWNMNIDGLKKHFGLREIWENYYRATNREEFLKPYQDDMDYAEAMGAEYAVFHINDVSNEEVLTYEWEHTNREVIVAAAEIINELTRGRNYHFKLLLENLFTPGMTLLNPSETELMLNLVNYENKGIVMDTGHLMCAPQNITEEEQGIDFVLQTVKNHGELAKYIKALHLHQSTTGNFVADLKTRNIIPEKDFYALWAQSYNVILNIDQHRPFTSPRVQEILELVEPEFVCHEISAKNRADKLEKVLVQMKALGRI